MKTYKTYQARNAVKAAQVTNHIIAAKKLGQTHGEAKAEAYRLYNIKKAIPILKKHFSVNENKSPVVQLPPLPVVQPPPLPVINFRLSDVGPSGLATTPPKELY